jgi:hypothetical protein
MSTSGDSEGGTKPLMTAALSTLSELSHGRQGLDFKIPEINYLGIEQP